MKVENPFTFSPGDVICKVASTTAPYPESVTYSIVPCDGVNSCLARSVNSGAAAIVAQSIKSIKFSYLFDDGQEFPRNPVDLTSDANLAALRAIRVTVTGQTINRTGSGEPQKTRQLTSVIRIRNRR